MVHLGSPSPAGEPAGVSGGTPDVMISRSGCSFEKNSTHWLSIRFKRFRKNAACSAVTTPCFSRFSCLSNTTYRARRAGSCCDTDDMYAESCPVLWCTWYIICEGGPLVTSRDYRIAPSVMMYDIRSNSICFASKRTSAVFMRQTHFSESHLKKYLQNRSFLRDSLNATRVRTSVCVQA